ncbi:type II toxin-antitoxin system VapC family toxin [Corallococcus exiguus]|nr:type II toxin-antitoxin system VapC family toxin [Corallococcus exiguus]NRD50811.1 type II toxin-antitoxin system VapC family toxin [Corallococcus exiguus]
MFDTNVLSFVFDPPTGRAEEAPSRELWDALVANRRDILIPAPSLAEFMRRGHKAPPAVRNVEIIPFDTPAALILATGLPMSVLKAVNGTGTSMTHLKFDSMIMACAARGRADVLVTFDPDHPKLKAQAGRAFAKLSVMTPPEVLAWVAAPAAAAPAQAALPATMAVRPPP